ncbi:MAG: DUF5615 family PIN-like protein [Armatimonadota bacterium]
MSCRIKLDENLAHAHQQFLQSQGYDVERVYEQGLSGASDAVIWQQVCAEGRLFITLDIDFADIRQYRPGTHPGVLLLRPATNSKAAVMRVLQRVCQEIPLETLKGCLAVADEQHTRIRRPEEQAENEV